MHAFVTSKNVKWCHLIWPTVYIATYVSVNHSTFHELRATCPWNDLEQCFEHDKIYTC